MYRLCPCLFALAFLLPMTITAQQGVFAPYPVFDGGGMRMHLSMYGQISHLHDSIIDGLLWPGDGASHGRLRGMCHSSTPVLVGTVNGERRVSASYYRDNFIPGPIIGGKPAVDPTDPFFRAYTVTWQETEAEDYREWPANLGAPVQENGEPYFYGRKQMFWVMNDLDAASMMENNGSPPLGLEMRCLLYEPWPAQARENTLLLQVTYINKGTEHITDAYAGYFMDADVRDPFVNLAGSDSVRNMLYSYDYNTLREETGMPTALGLLMLQTPVVEDAGKRARWFSDWKENASNIPVSAAILPLKWKTTPLSEPELGDDIAQWDALMRGHGAHGTYVLNPHTGMPSRFWLSGDPVRGTGWLPEHGLPLSNGEHVKQKPADTRMLISAGPFSLAPGDTQQVTYAIIATQGATAEAALHELQDRAEYMQAWFAQRPAATAYRSAVVRPANSITPPGQIDVNARFGDVPADLKVEVSDATGNVLIEAPLDRFSVEGEWVYRTTVTLPQAHRQGVNISFLSEWNGEQVRIPGRVSFPVGGSVDLDGIVMLEEGDDNGRVAPDEHAKWFPRFVNNSPYDYSLHAQSHFMPEREWLYVPVLHAQTVYPSDERPWTAEAGYNTLWDDTRTLTRDSMAYHFDVYDPAANTWWKRVNWIPTDSAAGEWYDVLMTQVRGNSDERPGVRLLDPAKLQNKWYVARIGGYEFRRTLSLYDSSSGLPWFEDYGLDVFTGPVPETEGFRIVHGTIGAGERPVSKADLYIFNPRHVLLARSSVQANTAVVSAPAPMPLTEWTSVTIELAEATPLRAEVYNTLGQRVSILREGFVDAGRHLLIWDGYWADGRPAEAGMYLLRIVADTGEVTRKVMVIR